MLTVYGSFLGDELCIPVVPGVKAESEKLVGALRTYSVEAMMGGKRRALQTATSYNLGDHFGRTFGILFLHWDEERRHAFNTSWGLRHRVDDAVMMVHGDGLKPSP